MSHLSREWDFLMFLNEQVGLYCPKCTVKLFDPEIALGLCDWCNDDVDKTQVSNAKDRHPSGKEQSYDTTMDPISPDFSLASW